MPTKKKTVKKRAAPKVSPEAKALAILFHDTYERLAPKHNYKTRPDTKKFKASTANGKLMIAVANEILASIPKPKPEKPTTESFEQFFFKLDAKHFIDISERWNEEKLKIKLVKQKDYDAWLNYFKDMPARSLQMLSTTGMDILPTEAYSALLRWRDILANPHRIDKIHQSGLTNNDKKHKDHKTIVQLATANDRLGVLKATRDQIAEQLQKGAGARDTAALAREMTEIMTQISDYEKRVGPKKTTELGRLLDDMHTKPRNKKSGARNTSFRSRITIEDVEAK